MSKLLDIDRLNSYGCTKEEFMGAVNILFETAPPLADHIYKNRPFESYLALIECAETACLKECQFKSEDLLDIVNAHPRIGAPKNSLSAQSQAEQGYAPDQKQPKETEEETKVNRELEMLNLAYENKFGFKFVVFVNGRSRKEIVQVLKARLENGEKSRELETGLSAMMQIARDRLKKLS